MAEKKPDEQVVVITKVMHQMWSEKDEIWVTQKSETTRTTIGINVD